MSERIGSLLVLTEDSASDAHATLVEVLKRMLREVVPHYQTHRLGFEPRDDKAQRAVQGTSWKTTKPSELPSRTDMLRTIATKLMRDDGFVFFHIDGDRPWSQRNKSENVEKFDSIVRAKVRQILVSSGATPASVEQRMRRLLLVMPFYSIESWAYQNTEVALRLCNDLHGGQDAERFQAWKSDRASLDEVVRPKGETCLRDSHNLALVGAGYPTREVFNAGCSYAECVLGLLQCDDLTAMLEQTTGYAI